LPLISVIIPTRNRAELLERAIKSVLNQTHRNLELLIIDDASVDNTRTIIEKYSDQKIKYYRLEERKGGAVARNKGIMNSTGTYIAFLDDDDEWMPEKLEKQICLLEKHAEAALCYTGRKIVREGGWLTGFSKKYSFSLPATDDQFKEIMSDNFIGVTSSVLVKREVLTELNGFDENLPAYQDYDLFIRILKKCKSCGIDEPLVIYHLEKINRVSLTRESIIEAEKLLEEKYKDEPYLPLLKRAFKRINRKKMLKSFNYAAEVIRN